MKHRPRKRFGQHFLHDPRVIQRIVDAIAPRAGEHLVEIGPGLGALTCVLLPRIGQLDAVELDRDLITQLAATCATLGELRIHSADALTFDFGSLATDGQQLRIVGNLPYNISTALLFHLLKEADVIRDMHFMLQREIVARLAAKPGGKEYGRLSVMTQYRCAVIPLFAVGPGAFSPPPKVDSAVVRLTPFAVPPTPAQNEHLFARLVKQAFSQRRKTLRNSLRGLLTAAQIEAIGIDSGLRPEGLSVAQFAALSDECGRIHATDF